MKKSLGRKSSFIPLLGNIALAVFGVVAALGLMELTLRTHPNWIPGQIRVNPPARRIHASVDESYDIRLSDGDLFRWMQGVVAPLPPEEDRVVAHVHMTTDAGGFRNTVPENDTYEIVAVGDSFTRGSGVATPWPQKLAEFTGRPTLNLGDVGFGPQDELNVLRQYGLKKQPRWVIWAYFEGNDLYDAAAYDQANPLLLTRFARFMLTQGIEARRDSRRTAARAAVAPGYRYPITATINHSDLEMTFFSSYISWLSIGGDVIERSGNFRIARETLLKARALSESAQAHFLLVFVPSKEHVYLPYLNDPQILASIFADVSTLELDQAGFLQFTNHKATLDLARQHIDDQARLLADFAAQQNMLFLDLTPAFQEEASAGAELYYPFDTHWNQQGNDLAAQAIGTYIATIH